MKKIKITRHYLLALALSLSFCGQILLVSGCASHQSPDSFDLNSYLQKQEGLQMYAGETLRTLQEEAKSGDTQSQSKLGVYYFIGYGTKPDPIKAFEMLRASADKGDSRAQFCLGMMYWKGNGVTSNLSEAYRYLTLASKGVGQDAEMARSFREHLKTQLPPAQVEEADAASGTNLLPPQN
jgi:TPR repeat protein